MGHELLHRGYEVLFAPAFKLAQRLIAAKRDLASSKPVCGGSTASALSSSMTLATCDKAAAESKSGRFVRAGEW
jgi:hypothetical protein